MSNTTRIRKTRNARIAKAIALPPPIPRNPMEKLLSRVTPANPCLRTDEVIEIGNTRVLVKDLVVAATAAVGGDYAPPGASLRFWSCLTDTALALGLKTIDTKPGHKAAYMPGHAPEDADWKGLQDRMSARASRLLEMI